MRIVIVTQEEPFYLPLFLKKVVEKRRKDIVGLIILSPTTKRSSWFSIIREHFEMYGLRGFLVISFRFVYHRVADKISYFISVNRRFHSIHSLALSYSIPVYQPKNINSGRFLNLLSREFKPDLIVSVNSSQVFKTRLMNLPRLGCINIHSSLLPKYRGRLPTFWVLANGERETGVTVHYMDEQLDNGDIILQAKVPIEPEETHHSLIAKCKRIGADLLLEALDQIENGIVVRKPNDLSQATYFSFPTRQDAKRLRGQGRRLL